MDSHQENPELLAQLIDEWQERLRKGERPDLEEYTRLYPELADEIRQLLPGLAALENLKGEALDRTIAPTGGLPVAEGGPALEQLGDYRILREVGRGGMGVVYEAEQISLGRHVALKVLPQKVILDARQKRRFEREAKAAAKLHHTNIVPVFGVGEYDGMPYYVMQFIQGLGLDAVMDEVKRMQGVPKSGADNPAVAPTVTRGDVSAADVARSLMTGNFRGGASSDNTSDPEPTPEPRETPTAPAPKAPSSENSLHSGSISTSTSSIHLPGIGRTRGKAKKQTYWQSVAAIGAQVADALDYAHTQGILHRDIKPSNLLLDTRGIVWVTDFGLAKASDHHDDLTHTGDVLGTLRYMPPEAFEGKSDSRADIYALGLTLYEMLALQPAFGEKDRHRLIKQVTTVEPEHLNRLNRAIPRDLATVIHKAIDREPGRRYQNARDFASDLERFIANEPVEARRSNSFERTLRWVHRRPAAAALVGVSAVAAMALAATIIVLLYSRELEHAKSEADLARAEAEHARDAEAAQRKVTEAALLETEKQRGLAETARHEAEVQREAAILQRGLLAVHTEQWPEAVKDLDGYTKAHANDLKAWLGLAKALGRIGDPQKSVDAYTKALALAPGENVDSRVEAHIGRAEQESGRGRLNAAIADYEKAFQLKPDMVQHATAFARDLYNQSAGWQVLRPNRTVAGTGIAPKIEADGSIVPEGNVSSAESYTIVSETDLAGIRAIRLETLPGDSQQNAKFNGQPGMAYMANNFVLAEFTVSAARPGEARQRVALNRAWSDFYYPYNLYYAGTPGRQSRRQIWDVNTAIDGDLETGWSVISQYGRSHTAVFFPSAPASKPGRTTLTIQLHFPTNPQLRYLNSIGRFRLSVSAKAPNAGWECLINNSTVNAWVKLAAAHFLHGDRTAALAALNRAEKQNGDFVAKQFLRSILYDQPSQKAEARAAYDGAVTQTKSNTYGTSMGDLTFHWLSVEASSRWMERERDNVQFRRNRADSLVTLENWPEAIADYTELIAKDPKDHRLFLERGYCYSRRGMAELARADFTVAGKLNPEETLAWHRQKLQLLEYAADIASSLLHLDACVALEKGKPGELEFLVKRGHVNAVIGRRDLASADFARALEVNPNSVEALLERGNCSAESGERDKGRADFVAARKLNAATALSWHLAQLNKYEYGPSRDLEMVLLHLAEIIEIDTSPATRAQYLTRRATALRHARRFTAAVADFDRLIELFPLQASYRVERADCLISAGQRDKAMADLVKAIELNRNSIMQQIQYKIDNAINAKDWLGAELYLNACLKIKHPSNDELILLRRRARVGAELGQYAAAIADCQRIFALAPNDEEGHTALAAAYVKYPNELRLQGKAQQAKQVAEQAKAFLKARAAAHPDDNRYSVELVNFLLAEAAGWQPLEIAEMKSAGGATMSRQADGSILVSGANPDRDVYSLSAKSQVALNAIRLDVLPDNSLPARGPGRESRGDFHLTDIKMTAASPDAANDFKPVRWRGAYATYVRPADKYTGPRDGPRGAIDGDPATRWDIWPKMGLPNAAMFSTGNPAGGPNGANLRIRLEFLDPLFKQFTLGRFRLAGSASRYAIHCVQLIAYPTGHWGQMAAGYALLGDRQAAEAALVKAEATPAGNDGGALLINAWVAELLGHPDRGRQARGKVIAWFGTKSIEDAVPIPAVAVDVLTKAVEDGARSDVARRWLARAIDAMGDDETALAAYDHAIHFKSDDSASYAARGNLLLRQHKWTEAVADFQKMIEMNPDEHYSYLTTAPIFLLAGDENGYRRFRENILQRFSSATDAAVAERMAKASSLLPGTRQETEVAVELAKRAVSSSRYPGFMHWFHLTAALTSYRADDFGAAIEHARAARDRDPGPQTVVVQVATRLIEAMAQYRLGKLADARSLLAEAEEIIHRDLPDMTHAVPDGNFHDYVLCVLLQREAEKAIDPDAGRREKAPMPREAKGENKRK